MKVLCWTHASHQPPNWRSLPVDIAIKHYRSNLKVEWKADGSPVTMADRAAETAAREWVNKYFPEDGLLGEEFGEDRPGAKRRWIIDPIDGTKTFVRGTPLWGTLVALCEGENVLAGASRTCRRSTNRSPQRLEPVAGGTARVATSRRST